MQISALYYPKYDKNWYSTSIRGKLLDKQFPMCGVYDFNDELILIQHLTLCNAIGVKNLFFEVNQEFVENGILVKLNDIINSNEINMKISFMIDSKDMIKLLNDIDESDNLFKMKGKKVILTRGLSEVKELQDFYTIGDLMNFSYENPDIEVLKQFDGITGVNVFPETSNITECVKSFDLMHQKYSNYLDDTKVDIWPCLFPRINNYINHESNIPNGIHDDSGQLLTRQLKMFSNHPHCIISSFNNWTNDTQIEPCGNEESYQVSEQLDENISTNMTDEKLYRNYCFDFVKIIERFTNQQGFIRNTESPIISTKLELDISRKKTINISFFYDDFSGYLFKLWNEHIISYLKIEDDELIYFKQGFIKGAIEKRICKLDKGKEYNIEICDQPQNYYININGEEMLPDELKFLTQDTKNLILFDGNLSNENIVGSVIVKNTDDNKTILTYPSEEMKYE